MKQDSNFISYHKIDKLTQQLILIKKAHFMNLNHLRIEITILISHSLMADFKTV